MKLISPSPKNLKPRNSSHGASRSAPSRNVAAMSERKEAQEQNATSAVPRRVTAADVARLAGVQQASVSVVLNGAKSSTTVSDAARERILSAASELGYQVSAPAQALASGRTRQIGVLAADATLESETRHSMLSGLSKVARERGYGLSLLPAAALDDAAVFEEILRGHVCDGIVFPAHAVSRRHLALLQEYSLPAVALGDYDTQSKSPIVRAGLIHVDIDNERLAREATQWLQARGHRRIAWVRLRAEANQAHAIALRRGYASIQQAAGEAEIDLPEMSAIEIAAFARGGTASAVIVRNMTAAMRWVVCLLQSGMHLPDEWQIMALVTPGEVQVLREADIESLVATHLHDPQRVAAVAQCALLDWIEGRQPRERVILAAPEPFSDAA